jgi:hypothetical protein
MIKESLLKSIIQDLSNCQHLQTKFTASAADWRPQPNMRSTLELMQYLTYIGGTMTKHFVNPSENRDEARDKYRANAKNASANVTFENFSEHIDREKNDIREVFSGITDADLSRMTYHPFNNEESTLFEALLTVARYLTAYRHQLFLYAKRNGAEIGTLNNWYGREMSQPAKQAAAVA